MNIQPYYLNAKKHDKKQITQIANSIREFGMNQPIVVDTQGIIIVGHGRYFACKKLGIEPEIKVVDLTEEQAKAYRLADNKLNESDWDMKLVLPELKLLSEEMFALTGFDKDLFIEDPYGDGIKGSIANDFLVPPFSILDTMSARWLNRKQQWLQLGIKSELGRSDQLITVGLGKLGATRSEKMASSTSIFDPVLCELMYKWFNTPSGSVLDPFCGGSVRGIIASKCAYSYTGIDLSKAQIKENIKQVNEVCSDNKPLYINGDSNDILCTLKGKYDLIFSCPPYADLEVYSDNEKDLSTKEHSEFVKIYTEIIKKSCLKLKNERFAVFVVTEVRDKTGIYYNFIGETIKAFNQAGLSYYNEIILKNSVGTLPLRIRKSFNNRKVGRMHQNILVFYKGDPKKIQNSFPQEMEFEELQGTNG